MSIDPRLAAAVAQARLIRRRSGRRGFMVPTVATGASYAMRQPLVTAGHSVALARFRCNGFPRHTHSVFANAPLSSMLNGRSTHSVSRRCRSEDDEQFRRVAEPVHRPEKVGVMAGASAC